MTLALNPRPRLLPVLIATACALVLAGSSQNALAARGAKTGIATDNGTSSDGLLIGYDRRAEVRTFIAEMVARHAFIESELNSVFARARYSDRAAQLINPLTSTKPTVWRDYEARIVDATRIDAGVRFWRAHQDDLARAEALYGVPREIIVGILGVETMYGKNMGKFRVIDALTTLAFDYPNKANDRSPFFREQLEDYLLFSRDNGLDVFALRGSYAGAIGMPQFMPESFIKYAVDFDGDGAIDLLNNASDAIGSVGNYLAQHGWDRDAATVYRTSIDPANFNIDSLNRLAALGSDPMVAAQEIRQAGLSFDERVANPARVALINLDNGADAPDFVVGTANFRVITTYNRSYFYAMSVIELGDAVRRRVQSPDGN